MVRIESLTDVSRKESHTMTLILTAVAIGAPINPSRILSHGPQTRAQLRKKFVGAARNSAMTGAVMSPCAWSHLLMTSNPVYAGKANENTWGFVYSSRAKFSLACFLSKGRGIDSNLEILARPVSDHGILSQTSAEDELCVPEKDNLGNIAQEADVGRPERVKRCRFGVIRRERLGTQRVEGRDEALNNRERRHVARHVCERRAREFGRPEMSARQHDGEHEPGSCCNKLRVSISES